MDNFFPTPEVGGLYELETDAADVFVDLGGYISAYNRPFLPKGSVVMALKAGIDGFEIAEKTGSLQNYYWKVLWNEKVYTIHVSHLERKVSV